MSSRLEGKGSLPSGAKLLVAGLRQRPPEQDLGQEDRAGAHHTPARIHARYRVNPV